MSAYYNEHDPFAAAWLRELIADGLIAPGVVDERSIEDVNPSELAGFVQCHFFAGIGIWSLALREAGWPDDLSVWTGSCPCQPFSAAGKGGGFADERHLWPAFHWLVEQCGPAIVVGEQVASKDGLAWLDLVSADLEASGYAFGAVDTCAAGFGAPHIRQRLYWMADADHQGESGRGIRRPGESAGARLGTTCQRSSGLCADGSLADAMPAGRAEGRTIAGIGSVAGRGEPCGYPDDARLEGRIGLPERSGQRAAGPDGMGGGMDDSASARHERAVGDAEGNPRNEARLRLPDAGRAEGNRPGPLNCLWQDADWLCCTDGKWRPVAPGTFPLAPAGTIRNRVGLLRGAGNAINLSQAQGFIEAVMDVRARSVAEAA